MEQYRIETERLRGIASGRGARTGEQCPDSEQFLKLAAGVLAEAESADVMDHAAGCDACGTLLKIAVEDLHNVEIPVEAEAAMGEPFRIRIASELRRRSLKEATPTPIFLRRRLWIGVGIAAGVALFVLAGVGPFGTEPEQLVARSYEANRAWPMRFPGASYAPLNLAGKSAGPGDTLLAEVDKAISKGFDAQPRDPRWLQLRSEVDFLRGRYDTAIAALEPLSEGSYISAGIWINLGIFHLARGMAGGAPGDAGKADAGKAIEYFNRTLDAEARNAIALFNRALAFEMLNLWDRAEQDWKSYLEVDSAGGWADEARDRLRQAALKRGPAPPVKGPRD